MKTPTCWDDLYTYFDAQDIFSHGALNLWNLVHLLCHENRIITRDLFASMCYEVGVWADEWLEKEGNKEKLLACDVRHADILSVLSDEEQKEISELREVDMVIVRGALAHRQEQLMGYERALARPFPANGLEVAWSNHAIHNWLELQANHPSYNLAGQPVSEKKSGLLSPSASHPVIVNGSSRVSSAAAVASGTAKNHHTAQPSLANATTQQVRPLGSTSNAVVANVPLSAVPPSAAYPSGAQAVPVIASNYPSATTNCTGAGTGFLRGGYTSQSTLPGPIPSNDQKPAASAEAGGSGPASATPARKTQAPATYRTPRKAPANASRHPTQPFPNQRDNQTDSSNPNSFGRAGHKDVKANSPLGVPRQRAYSGSVGDKASTAPVCDKTQGQTEAGKKATESAASPQNSGMFKTFPLETTPFPPWPKNIPIDKVPGAASRGWEYQNANGLHGPIYRRSPHKKNKIQKTGGRHPPSPKELSTASTTCQNKFDLDRRNPETKWLYTPCECYRCEERNRSVIVRLHDLPPGIDQHIVLRSLKGIMSRWGPVDTISRVQSVGSLLRVMYVDASRVLEAAESEDLYCDEFRCYISISAAYRTAYGQEWARRRGIFVKGYPRNREEGRPEHPRRDYTMPTQKNQQPYQQQSYYQNQSPPGVLTRAHQSVSPTAAPQESASRVSSSSTFGSRPGNNGVPMVHQLAVSSGFVQPGQPGYPTTSPQPGVHEMSGQTQTPLHPVLPAPMNTSAGPWAMQGQYHPVYPFAAAQTPSGQFIPTIGGAQPFYPQVDVHHPAVPAAIPSAGLNANNNSAQPSKAPASEKTNGED
ncbi:hypothetical protein ACRALDRAFT_1092346 [Sodiomyces alcalophilus JCM 7366]|uniref:uncharacterized protein n=1 Tax=Sodiomyces alcalophilus JCM 7366 TaxID=591952 RepID=UPI0039B6E3F2